MWHKEGDIAMGERDERESMREIWGREGIESCHRWLRDMRDMRDGIHRWRGELIYERESCGERRERRAERGELERGERGESDER